MQNEQEVNQAIDQYGDMVRRICLLHLKNISDAEDIFQEVFFKYALRTVPFESDAHEKAWLIRVAINACKDLRKSFFRSRTVSLDALLPLSTELETCDSQVLETVLSLPKQYKDAVYLHYYEGYPAVEIANILHKNVNTIYTRLARARKILQEKLGGTGDAR